MNALENLKKLDLNDNKWTSEVTTLIIKAVGGNLEYLAIGEKDYINEDTLNVLAKYCPKINSLSISKLSKISFEILCLHLKDFKLNTLQIHHSENDSTVMKSEPLMNYLKRGFLTLKISSNDRYWNYYNNDRDEFERLLEEHKIKLHAYKPDSLEAKFIF